MKCAPLTIRCKVSRHAFIEREGFRRWLVSVDVLAGATTMKPVGVIEIRCRTKRRAERVVALLAERQA